MIPAKFDYVRPGSLDEAVSALAGGGEDAKVIAGGQSLLPLLRLRLAYPELLVDVGAVVNPLIVEGQVHGGLAQGIAQALYEEAVYDDDGNLVTSTLADYLVPSAADLPSYVTDRTESRAANRLGVKGVGEAGTIASTPAVVNAIVDALRPLGINDVEMPCTPERVWRAI